MADRRMFTKKVTDDDNFMALSSSAQALYLHLSMSADDDGFCNQVSISMFKAHASVQDLQALLEKRYVYQFENGVIVIKHWRMANALRKDRYTPTIFQEELSMLDLKDNGTYDLATERQPDGNQCLPQVRLGKDSIGYTLEAGKEKRAETAQKKEESKKPYGVFENVMLTDDELQKLKQKFKSDWQSKIDNLSEYIASKGKKYKSHYATILVWDRKNNGGKPSEEKEYF